MKGAYMYIQVVLFLINEGNKNNFEPLREIEDHEKNNRMCTQFFRRAEP